MLKKLTKKFRYGQKGFTLIELLVVVAILGVLAAVAIPNVSKFIGEGQTEALNSEVSSLQTALTAYMVANDGRCPASGDYATADTTTGDTLVPDYLSKAPEATYTWDPDDGSILTGAFDGYAFADGKWTKS